VKVLFDQNVPAKLRKHLRGHWITTAAELGWAELKNGNLLAAGESAGFEAMITCDQSIQYQQNLSNRKIAILTIDTNDWNILKPHAQLVADTLLEAQSSGFLSLRIPKAKPKLSPKFSPKI